MAGFFENLRSNTQALINTNLETEKSLKGSVLPILERLHKEIKHKAKELAGGAQKGAKEVEKARNTTQKHIELLGQQTASFDSTGGRIAGHEDPYVVHRGILHRLSSQVMIENNHHNDLIAVQNNFATFESHVVEVIQQAMEAFTQLVGGQAEKTRALHHDILGNIQQVPPEFEWANFTVRNAERLAQPNEPPRAVDAITFPNMDHPSVTPIIEGSLERKSRNKLSWGMSTGYYVVTASKYLHEFKDSDNTRQDPKPELSIYLPEAAIGAPSGDKFSVKGKDKSKTMSSKFTGSSELNFKAHTADEAQKWFSVIQTAIGGTGPAADSGSVAGSTPVSPLAESPSETIGDKLANNSPPETGSPVIGADQHKAQESGVTASPPVTATATATEADEKVDTKADTKVTEKA